MSIFEKQDATPSDNGASQTPTPEQTDALTTLLAEIKNESGEQKYKDVPTALEALKHSQQYIPDLKNQNDSLTAELESFKAQQDKVSHLESIVEKLTASKEPETTPVQGIDEQKVAELLEQKLKARDLRSTEESNLNEVTSALSHQFGDEAESTFYNTAQELGFTKESFEALAKANPKAVLKLFPEQKPAVNVSSGHNSAGLFSSTPQGEELAPPEKSVMAGASTQELVAEFRRHADHIKQKYNID